MKTSLKRTALSIVAASFFSPLLSTAEAGIIPGLFNTGVSADNSLASPGTVELHYSLIQTADPSATVYVVSSIPGSGWIVNGPGSQWIAPSPNQNFSGQGDTAGDYVYRLTFDLTGFDPTTASIGGLWAIDNVGQDILINGVSTGNYAVGTVPIGFSAFSIASGFVAGLNTLDFLVTNSFPPQTRNPTGLRVEFSSATASLVPIPATSWLFALGVIVLIGGVRGQARVLFPENEK